MWYIQAYKLKIKSIINFEMNYNKIKVGTWSLEKKKNYNLMDVVSNYTIQVCPNSWAVTLLTFNDLVMWNVRSECMERANYLGQQLYISVLTIHCVLRDEFNMPDNALLCCVVKDMPKPKPADL